MRLYKKELEGPDQKDQVHLICSRSHSIVKFLNKFFRTSSACIRNTKAAVSTAGKDGCFFSKNCFTNQITRKHFVFHTSSFNRLIK